MSLYDRFRWSVLGLFALYHSVVCGLRAASSAPQTQWLHDRPDWFVKLLSISVPETDNPIYRRMHQQALIELDFRRATGVSK